MIIDGRENFDLQRRTVYDAETSTRTEAALRLAHRMEELIVSPDYRVRSITLEGIHLRAVLERTSSKLTLDRRLPESPLFLKDGTFSHHSRGINQWSIDHSLLDQCLSGTGILTAELGSVSGYYALAKKWNVTYFDPNKAHIHAILQTIEGKLRRTREEYDARLQEYEAEMHERLQKLAELNSQIEELSGTWDDPLY